MLKKIILNNQELTFIENDLPLLIHGGRGAGSSLFTITAIAQFYKQGSKVIFYSGYPMAKDEFKTQVGTIDANSIEIIKSGEEKDLIETLEGTQDLKQKIVLIKNVELLSEKSFAQFKDLTKLIISGDFEKCSFKEKLLEIPYKTIVLFSPLSDFGKSVPSLGKYEGYMFGNREGVVKVEV